jgi:hypothetical protein
MNAKKQEAVMAGKPDRRRLHWNMDFPFSKSKRKRAWSRPGQTNSFAAVGFGWWLKNYEPGIRH